MLHWNLFSSSGDDMSIGHNLPIGIYFILCMEINFMEQILLRS